MRLTPALAALAAAALASPPLRAGELSVDIMAVRSAQGQVLVALCDRQHFLTEHCANMTRAQAQEGRVHIVLESVQPGEYALQVIHDENGNNAFDRNLIGFPVEGYGFSNDPPTRFGPPDYEDAAINVPAEGGTLSVGLVYR